MTTQPAVPLELDDIQAPVLHPRPTRYAGAVILARIDDRRDGRELLRRLIDFVPSASDPPHPDRSAWASVALSFQGLKALGVPDDTLAGFPQEFQQGMAARAAELGDTGESAPEHWESPLGSPDVHVVIYALAPDAESLEATLAGARDALREIPGVAPIWLQDTYMLPNERTSFGFKDGISHPAIEGSGIPGTNPREEPFKAGEFILGYPNENGELPPMPQPEVLGRNGTYVVFRKLQTRVAAYRQYIRSRAETPADEELLAAKFVGRWPSGAPLVLAPERDESELGADPGRNNAFLFAADGDARGLKCPLGAHARRTNPRDSAISGIARNHRMIRRSSSYGPMLPKDVLEDDGADRGILFFCLQARLAQQFEFVKTQWINDGTFFGTPAEMDPFAGPNDGTGRFTIPQQPIRRRLTELPQFVVNRGGEYCFMPGLRALRWLAALDT
ncbi:Dyp-type peroxidase [Solirubrobacter ginsenosidimutans]|uniref:Dyp-type peroxidase n=1 Tax=Solirubrobacter ginsenosidimutans TaxID=490573 RepID=A0A9X3MUG9_9ACTN|nr:Dyp-type peroxidase [Solirubrobacter ginsenosidimutans]MDA0162627.1 Dyp-type peroxidase [Solirubrobacter ginsenosidimutans]